MVKKGDIRGPYKGSDRGILDEYWTDEEWKKNKPVHYEFRNNSYDGDFRNIDYSHYRVWRGQHGNVIHDDSYLEVTHIATGIKESCTEFNMSLQNVDKCIITIMEKINGYANEKHDGRSKRNATISESEHSSDKKQDGEVDEIGSEV